MQKELERRNQAGSGSCQGLHSWEDQWYNELSTFLHL